MKIGFSVRKGCSRCASIVQRIVEILPEDCDLYYDRETARFLDLKGTDIDRMKVDMVIAVGGDGTVLRAIQRANTPVLGINMGGLGFLSEVEIGDVERSMYRIMRNDYRIESTMKLKVLINGVETMECTNEAVIHTSKIAKIRKFKLYIGDNFFDTTTADGLIIATPIGSTSYSYSAGGPIIYPTLDAAVISYIAPFRSRIRPVVFPSDKEIFVRFGGKDQSCVVILDGQTQYNVDERDEISIRVSENKARFVTFRESFYDRIREKLIKNVVY